MKRVIPSIRNAARQLWTSRLFTATAVLTLGLGIGGTTAIFSLIDAVMLRPLPVSDPARLYRVGDGDDTIASGRHGRWGFFSFALYERLKTGTPEFEDITAFGISNPLSVRRQGADNASRPLGTEYVTGTYFSTLGVPSFSGRLFAADDDRPSASPVAVLSHHAWRAIYGADPAVVGGTFIVEGHPFTVIGVAAPGFFGETLRAEPPDIWIPLQQEPLIAGGGSLLRQSTASWLAVIGRVRQDASIAGMAPRLSEMLRQWIQYDARYPSSWMPDIIRDLPKQTIQVVPAGAGIGFGGISVKEQYGSSLQILFAICSLVLVIACANVANLLLARALARRTETAVRLAMGATRRQIVAASLTESVLLAIAGGIVGLFVAVAAARLLLLLAFQNSRLVPIETTPSLAVLAFAVGVSLVTGIAFGTAPAWLRTRTDPIDALRGSRGSTGHPSSRSRTVLLVVQGTLCVVVIAGSTMLARSLAKLEQQDLGYKVQGRVLVNLKRLPSTYTPEQLSVVYADIERRLASLPGVRGLGLALYNPLTSNWNETILVAGHSANPNNESGASWNRVSADYLQQLGVTTVRGRLFTAADNKMTAPVAVVNEAFVKRFFKDTEDPLDQYFGLESRENAGTFRIVGVVLDTKFARSGLNQPARPMFFLLHDQRIDYKTDYRRMVEGLSHFMQGIMLVTDSLPGDLEPLLRRTLSEADPNLTIMSVRTLQQQVDLSFDRERAVARLAQLFGIVALLFAAVGVYSVTIYMVAQQTHEIGIRMALGANRVKVIQLVLRHAFQRVAIGLLAGVPLAVGAARFMAAQLYGVPFWDPLALSIAAGSLAAFTLFGAFIPALRAAAISPINALRTD